MTAKLPVIDGDAHVVEPFSLWEEELPERFRGVARQRIVNEAGQEELFHHGRPLGLEWTIGTLCTPGSGSPDGRLDIDLDSEVHPGVSDPKARLQVMDEQGIAVSVLFPSCTLGLDDVSDLDFRWAYARTYNSWIAEYCRADPIRLRWAAVLPLAGLEQTMVELERCLDLGATTVMLSPLPQSGPGAVQFASPDRESLCHNLGHPDLDPLWRGLVDQGLPAVVHAVNPAANAWGIGWVFANRVQWQMGQPWQMQMAVMHMIEGGAFDRHPDLKVGFFEGDVGWLPHWLGRLGSTYEKFALMSKRHPRTPLETFKAQCWISGEPGDRGLADTVREVGSRVVFGSDWPHMDGAWPDPILIVRDHPALSPGEKRSILLESPAELFSIDLPSLVWHLGDGWSLDGGLDDLTGLLPSGYEPGRGTVDSYSDERAGT